MKYRSCYYSINCNTPVTATIKINSTLKTRDRLLSFTQDNNRLVYKTDCTTKMCNSYIKYKVWYYYYHTNLL